MWPVRQGPIGRAEVITVFAAQIADYFEEMFEATGSRGGFMLGHSQCGPRDPLHNIVDLLVPELQRRGCFRTSYTGRTLREKFGRLSRAASESARTGLDQRHARDRYRRG